MNMKQNFDIRDTEAWWRTGQEDYQRALIITRLELEFPFPVNGKNFSLWSVHRLFWQHVSLEGVKTNTHTHWDPWLLKGRNWDSSLNYHRQPRGKISLRWEWRELLDPLYEVESWEILGNWTQSRSVIQGLQFFRAAESIIAGCQCGKFVWRSSLPNNFHCLFGFSSLYFTDIFTDICVIYFVVGFVVVI